MLSRLIISQVCHHIVTWASKVLTSTSFHFLLLCLCSLVFSYSTIFLVSHPFPPPFLSPRHRWGEGFTGCVRCQIQWKTVGERRLEKRRHAALKSDGNKRCGFVSGNCCSLDARSAVSAAAPPSRWCSCKQEGGVNCALRSVALTWQITTQTRLSKFF